MPVPSTMMGLRLTRVLTPNSLVTLQQNFIMGTGPMHTASLMSLSLSRVSFSLSVTKPLWP